MKVKQKLLLLHIAIWFIAFILVYIFVTFLGISGIFGSLELFEIFKRVYFYILILSIFSGVCLWAHFSILDEENKDISSQLDNTLKDLCYYLGVMVGLFTLLGCTFLRENLELGNEGQDKNNFQVIIGFLFREVREQDSVRYFVGYIVTFVVAFIVAYIVGFVIGRFKDIFYNKHNTNVFFHQIRGDIFNMIIPAIIGMVLSMKLFAVNCGVASLGCLVGLGIGGWVFENLLQWGNLCKEKKEIQREEKNEILQEEKNEMAFFETKVHYLFVLFQLFKISNTDTDLCRSAYLSIYERVLPISDTTKRIVKSFDNLLDVFQNDSEIYNYNDLPQILSSIPKDMQISLLRDYLCCIYSANKVSQAQKDMGKEICNHYGQFYDIMEFYDRSNTKPKTGKFYDALKALGLTAPVTQEEIGSAYRNLIKQYHPDRLLNASEPIREFAKQKTIEINAAYEFLRDQEQFEDEEMILFFLDPDSDRLFFPKANATFICRCRLCLEKNRIQAGQDRKAARCRKCHALLGEEQ